jgi:putative MATE family efflux protein
MSLPIFIETALQMMVPNVDQFMLSHYSRESVAAVGNDNVIFNLVILSLAVLSQAATILIAHHRGAGDMKKVSEVCTVALFTNLVLGLIISFALFIFDDFFLDILGIPPEIRPDASLYIRWIGLFVFIQALYMAFISFLRGFARLKLTMLCSMVMNIMNISGNMVLIHGLGPIPPLGVTGVCISTNISKFAGFFLIIYLFLRYTPARLSLSYLKPFPKDTFHKLLYLGIPSGGETFSYQLSQTVIMKFVNIFGVAVITTKVYCYIIAMMSYVYSQSLAMATQILVGYFKGAGNNEEVDKRVKFTISVAMVLSGSIATLLYLNSDSVLSIFTSDPEVLALGKTILFIEIFLEIGRAVNMCMVMALNASGDVRAPVTVGIIFMWSVATFGAWLLGVHLYWGLAGIWIAMAADECTRGLVFFWRWHKGVWRKRLV